MRANRFLFSSLAAVLISMTVVGMTTAADQPTPGERALKYRKSLYQVIVWNFGPMSAMAQDKMPYDPAGFAERAQRIAQLTPMLAESYPPESKGVADSKLKSKMWDNRADFDAKLQDLVDESAKLAQVAKTGDEAASKQAFFDTANACKSCHDEYKADD